MPIRNPFRRAPGVGVVDDGADGNNANNVGVKPLQIKEPTEYKLSGTFCTAGCQDAINIAFSSGDDADSLQKSMTVVYICL